MITTLTQEFEIIKSINKKIYNLSFYAKFANYFVLEKPFMETITLAFCSITTFFFLLFS